VKHPLTPEMPKGPRERALRFSVRVSELTGSELCSAPFQQLLYIIPDMSGMPPPPPPAFFSGASATIASVVRMFFAIDAAF
jgi:hypothetical protein